MLRSIFFPAGLALLFMVRVNGQTPLPASLPMVPDINVRAITLVQPAFPESALAAGADGAMVAIRVVVDERGDVISAKCAADCHPMLKDAAELAAASSKFTPLVRNGQAVKYQGYLQYNFVVDRIDWFRFGSGLESVREFDNIAVGPVARQLSAKFADERDRLIALDARGVELETRWKVIREVEASLSEKLKNDDRWRFRIGLALRRVTFWTQAGEKTDRALLQNAIDELPKYIAGAPEDIPEKTIEMLTAVSKYHVPPDLPERDLRQEISNMTRAIIIK
jgi:hypothetical protein